MYMMECYCVFVLFAVFFLLESWRERGKGSTVRSVWILDTYVVESSFSSARIVDSDSDLRER